jgi:hypothetical protein
VLFLLGLEAEPFLLAVASFAEFSLLDLERFCSLILDLLFLLVLPSELLFGIEGLCSLILDLLFLLVLPSELLFGFGLEVEPWSESKLVSEISAFIVLMGFVIL